MRRLTAAAAVLSLSLLTGIGALAAEGQDTEGQNTEGQNTEGQNIQDRNAAEQNPPGPAELLVGPASEMIAQQVIRIGEEVAAAAADPYRDRPDIDPDDWMYILANPWNDIGDYTPELVSLEGQQFDVRIAEDMKAMAEAARAEGLSVVLSSGYRSYATQTYLFNRKVSQYGEAVAETIVARPGTSEHQTGLCCDITDRYYEMKDASLENTQMYKWMSEHCDEFGFIVRFPKGKEDVTGIIYEPWHFRYVGVEAATYIMEHDLTLEEFLALYRDEAGAE